jgi:hypothetical protein
MTLPFLWNRNIQHNKDLDKNNFQNEKLWTVWKIRSLRWSIFDELSNLKLDLKPSKSSHHSANNAWTKRGKERQSMTWDGKSSFLDSLRFTRWQFAQIKSKNTRETNVNRIVMKKVQKGEGATYKPRSLCFWICICTGKTLVSSVEFDSWQKRFFLSRKLFNVKQFKGKYLQPKKKLVRIFKWKVWLMLDGKLKIIGDWKCT